MARSRPAHGHRMGASSDQDRRIGGNRLDLLAHFVEIGVVEACFVGRPQRQISLGLSLERTGAHLNGTMTRTVEARQRQYADNYERW